MPLKFDFFIEIILNEIKHRFLKTNRKTIFFQII
jgi:hypothetical protein